MRPLIFLLVAAFSSTVIADPATSASPAHRNEGSWTLLGAFGQGLIGLVDVSEDISKERIIQRAKTKVDAIADDFDLRKGVKDQLEKLNIRHFRKITGDVSLDVVENELLLVDGNVDIGTVTGSIVIVRGKVKSTVVVSSVLAASGDVSATHIGGRNRGALVLTRERLDSTAVYGSAIFAEKGASVSHPTYLQAFATDVDTPHPSAVDHKAEKGNPLKGFSAGIFFPEI